MYICMYADLQIALWSISLRVYTYYSWNYRRSIVQLCMYKYYNSTKCIHISYGSIFKIYDFL